MEIVYTVNSFVQNGQQFIETWLLTAFQESYDFSQDFLRWRLYSAHCCRYVPVFSLYFPEFFGNCGFINFVSLLVQGRLLLRNLWMRNLNMKVWYFSACIRMVVHFVFFAVIGTQKMVILQECPDQYQFVENLVGRLDHEV